MGKKQGNRLNTESGAGEGSGQGDTPRAAHPTPTSLAACSGFVFVPKRCWSRSPSLSRSRGFEGKRAAKLREQQGGLPPLCCRGVSSAVPQRVPWHSEPPREGSPRAGGAAPRSPQPLLAGSTKPSPQPSAPALPRGSPGARLPELARRRRRKGPQEEALPHASPVPMQAMPQRGRPWVPLPPARSPRSFGPASPHGCRSSRSAEPRRGRREPAAHPAEPSLLRGWAAPGSRLCPPALHSTGSPQGIQQGRGMPQPGEEKQRERLGETSSRAPPTSVLEMTLLH